MLYLPPMSAITSSTHSHLARATRRVGLMALFAGTVGIAQAIPTLFLDDGAGHHVTVADGAANDASSDPGVVTFNGALGVWTINVSTGISDSPVPFIDLNSIDRSKSAGTLTIWFSDTGFNKAGGAQTQIGGTTTGSVTFASWWDPQNRLFAGLLAPGIPLTPSTTYSTRSFSGDAFAPGSVDGVYSLTEMLKIKHRGSATSSFDALITVPDSGTSVALLGTAILGVFGLASARRRSRSAA